MTAPPPLPSFLFQPGNVGVGGGGQIWLQELGFQSNLGARQETSGPGGRWGKEIGRKEEKMGGRKTGRA